METKLDRIIDVGPSDIRESDTVETGRQSRTILSLIGAGILIVGAIVGSAATAGGWLKGGDNKVPIYVSTDARVNESVTFNGGFSAIAKVVTPAVVTINVKSRQRQQLMQMIPDPFRDFFDRPDQPGQPGQDDEGTPRRRSSPRPQQTPGPLRPSGVGSGVIVSPDGYILTNNHVLEGADKVEVVLNDRRQFTAKVIGADAPSDVAVIKIDATNLPTIPIGDSEKVEVGDLVLAIGNPLGVGQTVTMGIISAKGRQSPSRDNRTYEDFLQTDAAINRGNSGGALVNLRGELIGVPSQILSQTGGNIGIGFAIPTKMARTVMDQLIRSGKVRRGLLGVNIEPINTELAKQFGYKGTEGAFVQDVTKGNPAEQAGVQPGDIITEYQGERIKDRDQLRNLVSSTTPGTTVKFKIWRDGSERELAAKLAEVDPGNKDATPQPDDNSNSGSGTLSGVRVETLTPDISQRMKLASNIRGVIVTEVDPDSPAAEGLQRGDIIESVNKQPVTNVNEFNSAIQKTDKKEVLLRVHNRGVSRFVLIKDQE